MFVSYPSSVQAEKEGTVESLVPWTVVGRLADVRRTVVSGAHVVRGGKVLNNTGGGGASRPAQVHDKIHSAEPVAMR